MDYVLVAERSLKEIVPVTLASLRRHGRARSVGLIVPRRDLQLFAVLGDELVNVIPESAVLPDWPLSAVADRLSLPFRAGWYLQQFLKLTYGEHAGLSTYVIWDADTVMLRDMKFTDNGTARLNLSKEHHEPYFSTYRKVTGRDTVLKKSAISQYLVVETEIVRQLARVICEQTRCDDWIEGVLRSLPGNDASEFSEYETYANFLAREWPDRVSYADGAWFRYGSEILPASRWNGPPEYMLDQLERMFHGYVFVAFERHQSNWIKRIAAHVFKFLRIGA